MASISEEAKVTSRIRNGIQQHEEVIPDTPTGGTKAEAKETISMEKAKEKTKADI